MANSNNNELADDLKGRADYTIRTDVGVQATEYFSDLLAEQSGIIKTELIGGVCLGKKKDNR